MYCMAPSDRQAQWCAANFLRAAKAGTAKIQVRVSSTSGYPGCQTKYYCQCCRCFHASAIHRNAAEAVVAEERRKQEDGSQ